MSSAPRSRGRLLIPAVYICSLGILAAVFSLGAAIMFASGDPVDPSVQATELKVNTARIIAIFGLAYLIMCIVSTITWVIGKTWGRHLMFAATVVGTLTVLFALGIIEMIPCAPLLLVGLVVTDFALVKVLYSRPQADAGPS